MKRQDRTGSDWRQYERTDPPAKGTRVIVADEGSGVVSDWPTFDLTTVTLDDGRTVKVAHDRVEKKS